MKKILVFLLCLLNLSGYAQHWNKIYSYNEYLGLQTDSILIPPQDTLASAPNGAFTLKGASVYVKIGGVWQLVTTGGGGSDSGISILYAPLSNSPIQLVHSIPRFFIVDTSFGNIGAITTQGSRQKLADSLVALISAKLSAVSTTNSVQGNGTSGSPIQLAGDVLSPGASKYYGTDGSGAKGYVPLPAGVAPANPTSSVGLSPINGIANTYMRSDAAPALAQQPDSTLIGNNLSVTATPTYLTPAQVITMLNAITNFGGNAHFLGYGLYASHPTSAATGLYFATDSTQTGGWFYWNGSAMINLTPQVAIQVLRLGQPGDSSYFSISGSILTGYVFHIAAMRDSSTSCVHHIINGDGSWTWYSTCSAPTNPYLGTLYGKVSQPNTADFTTSGGMSISSVSNRLNITTTSPGSFSSVADITAYGYTNLENVGLYMQFKVDSAKASYAQGPGLYFHSTNSHVPATVYLYPDLRLGGTGRIYLAISYPSFLVVDSSLNSLVYSTGDSIELTLQKQFGNIYVATARNVSSGALPISFTYSYSEIFNSPGGTNNTGYFAIGNLGGLYTIDSIQIYSPIAKRPSWMWIGDSKVVGYGSDFTNRTANLLKQNVPDLVVHAGGGDRTSEVQNCLPEIENINPVNVIISTGANDPDSNTTKTNISSLVTSLQAHGITCYFANFFQSTNNNLWQYNWEVLTYGSQFVFDITHPLMAPGMLNSDDVHPTGAGDTVAYYSMIASGKFPLVAQPNKLQLRSTEIIHGYMSAQDKQKQDSLWNYGLITSFLQPQYTGPITVQDKFQRANTSDIAGSTPSPIDVPGDTWHRIGSPTAGIVNDSLYSPVAANVGYYVSAGSAVNLDVSVIIGNNGYSQSGSASGVTALDNGSNTRLQMTVVAGPTGGFLPGSIVELIGGTATTLFSSVGITAHIGDTFHLKVLNGTAYSYQNSTLIGSAPYSPTATWGTNAGFEFYFDTTTKFMQFQVFDATNSPNYFKWAIAHDNNFTGDGSHQNPLTLVGSGATITTDGSTTGGNGSVGNPVHVNNGGIGTSQLAANAVTYGKLQTSSGANVLLGSTSSGGTYQEIALGTNLSITGGTLNASGGSSASLNSGFIGVGNGSNVMNSSGYSGFTYNSSTTTQNTSHLVIGTGAVPTNNFETIRAGDTLNTYQYLYIPTPRGDTATVTSGGNYGFFWRANGWDATNGISDNFFSEGYNYNGAGARANSHEATFYNQLETDATTNLFKYDIGGLVFQDGSSSKTLEFQIGKGTNSGAQVIGHSDIFDWYQEANTTSGMTFNAVAGQMSITGSTPTFSLNPSSGSTYGNFTVTTNSSGNTTFSNGVSSTVGAFTWNNAFTISPSNTVAALTLAAQSGSTVGINFTGNTTGSYTPINLTGAYAGGVGLGIVNTSATAGAYASMLLQSAGGGSSVNSSGMITFRNNGASSNKDFTIGQNSVSNNFEFHTSTAGLLGSGLLMSLTKGGNLLIGTATDNNGFLQLGANTTTNASMFFNGAASDVTSPTNGMLWYNSTAHTLNFRDNGVTKNLLTAGSNYQTVQAGGSAMTQRPVLNFTGASANVTDNSGNTSTDVHLPGIIFAETANGTALTNSTTNTAILGTGIGSGVTAANSLIAGSTITIHGYFMFSTASSPGTLTLENFDGAGGFASAFTPPASITSNIMKYDETITIISTGSSGSAAASIDIITPTGGLVPIANGTYVINTTISHTWGVNAQWGTASSSNSIQALMPFTIKVE